MLSALLQALRIGFNRSLPLRHLRNRLRFPGLSMDPSVNQMIRGSLSYGETVAIGEGCNLIVPEGATLRLGDRCYVGRYVELGPLGTIDIGPRSSLQDRCILVGDVTIGRYCLLSLNVLMTSGTHYFDRWPHLLMRDQDAMVAADPELSGRHSRPIEVADDCWLGMNSVVMPGVSIGRGCVVGSNAVVTRDVPPYSVVAGAPAKLVRQRLAFIPPRRLDWRDPDHLPYFYSGFELAQDEREGSALLGGHVTRARCALWLDSTGASEIAVRARSVSGSEAVISCAGVTASVVAQWRDCRFPVPAQGPAWFDVSRGAVAVSEARAL